MVEMVDARRSAEKKEEHRDLFSGLLDTADDDQDISEAITEPELFCKCRLLPRITLMKKILTRYPSEYVCLPSCWT